MRIIKNRLLSSSSTSEGGQQYHHSTIQQDNQIKKAIFEVLVSSKNEISLAEQEDEEIKSSHQTHQNLNLCVNKNCQQAQEQHLP